VALLGVGILVGPAALGWIHHNEIIEFFSQLGIALLLFLVGLRLDVQLVRRMGPVALATGLGQVVFTSLIGFGIASLMGMDMVTSAYVAIALTFSSTIIIVKLLSDKNEIDSLHGQIAIGFLIVQDIVVIALMIVLAALSQQSPDSESSPFLLLLLRGGIYLTGLFLFGKFVLPSLVKFMASSRELLVLFSIAWAALNAALAQWLGLSKEVGAFLAGISLASSPFRDALGSRLVAIRDFLLVFFFIALGSQLDLGLLGSQLTESIVFSLFVLVGNPLIVILIMGWMGYRARTGFLAGLTVAQISEFSLIFAAMGLAAGHIEKETLGLITLVGIITIGISTYLITYSHFFYRIFAPVLKVMERRAPKECEETRDNTPRSRTKPSVLVLGLGRLGRPIAKGLASQKIPVLAVDFDPETIRNSAKEKYSALYGDVEDPEFFTELPLDSLSWVICTVSNPAAERIVMDALGESDYEGKIALVSLNKNQDSETELNRKVDMWLQPFDLAAERVVEQIAESL
jgi:Kef-type K+ transport system membrane component KefB